MRYALGEPRRSPAGAADSPAAALGSAGGANATVPAAASAVRKAARRWIPSRSPAVVGSWTGVMVVASYRVNPPRAPGGDFPAGEPAIMICAESHRFKGP